MFLAVNIFVAHKNWGAVCFFLMLSYTQGRVWLCLMIVVHKCGKYCPFFIDVVVVGADVVARSFLRKKRALFSSQGFVDPTPSHIHVAFKRT